MALLWLLLITMRLGFATAQATIPGATAQAKVVEIHNKFRCGMCNTPKLAWDDALAQNAKDYMATGAPEGHCPKSGSTAGCVGNGENMYSGTAADDAFEWERAVDMWFASEIDCYNFDDGTNTCTAGHMTAVAWDLTTKVGCASNDAATGGMKTICMYQKPGNSNGPSNYINHVHKCPTAVQYEYYTSAASCCNGPQTNCQMKDGKEVCGWEYAKATTTTGCPADPGCPIHASCSAEGSTDATAKGSTNATTPALEDRSASTTPGSSTSNPASAAYQQSVSAFPVVIMILLAYQK